MGAEPSKDRGFRPFSVVTPSPRRSTVGTGLERAPLTEALAWARRGSLRDRGLPVRSLTGETPAAFARWERRPGREKVTA